MQKINKKGNSALYTVIVIFIAMTIGYIVLNKVISLTRDIGVGKSKQEILNEIYEKGNIALESVKMYNSDSGNKFGDTISCPDEAIVFYGEPNRDGIMETLVGVMDLGLVKNESDYYCSGNYEMRFGSLTYDTNIKIKFGDRINSNNNYFSEVERTYKGVTQTKNLVLKNKNIEKDDSIGINNITLSPGAFDFCNELNIIDGSESSYCQTEDDFVGEKYIQFDFDSDYKNIENIILKKPEKSDYYYYYELNYKDGSSELSIPRHFIKGETEQTLDLDLKTFGSGKELKGFKIKVKNLFDKLVVSDVEIYSFVDDSPDFIYEDRYGAYFGNENRGGKEGELIWTNVTEFSDLVETGSHEIRKIIFTSDGTNGTDSINDNFDSDNYKITSTGDIYYPYNHIDDDTVPRLTFFGNVDAKSDYYNIFWNNYKTNDFIDSNPNNIDDFYLKAGDEENAILYLDLQSNLPFSSTETATYDLKIVEFSGSLYQNKNSLFVEKTYIGTGLIESTGSIVLDDLTSKVSLGESSLGTKFDLKNKNFAIFIKDNSNFPINYKLTAKNETGSGIYINPINDFGTGTIEVLANYLTQGTLKNYIGYNEKITSNK